MDKKIWNKTRLDRMLVEYLLRQGYYETALELADNAGVGDLTNTEVCHSGLGVPFNIDISDNSRS